jgi:hypothetical protein
VSTEASERERRRATLSLHPNRPVMLLARNAILPQQIIL